MSFVFVGGLNVGGGCSATLMCSLNVHAEKYNADCSAVLVGGFNIGDGFIVIVVLHVQRSIGTVHKCIGGRGTGDGLFCYNYCSEVYKTVHYVTKTAH